MMNPYVGPRTFTQAESHLFFGREQEARDLFSRVISERLLLFYATSGAGKSSLLQTRLMPKLQEQGWIVLPVARVSGALPTGIAHVPNIYRFNLMLSLDRSQRDPQRLVDLSLAQFLRQLSSDDGESFYYDDTEAETAPSTTPYILIIDQFEELLTTHAQLWQQRAEFLRELNETLRADPMLSVLLTLREDYVAALDPYAQLVDNSLRARFYMTRMGYEAALTAVTEPAKLGQRPFTDDAARQLVANLSQIKQSVEVASTLGQFIEPVQLQVVCYQLWEKLVSATADRAPEAITGEDLERYGNVDNALASFYEQVLRQVLPLYPQVAEAELRQWFDQQLITPAQTRGLVFQGQNTAGMPNELVHALSRVYLLHVEQRAAGAYWVELVHDRFVEPILQANQAWLNQNPLMSAAQAWDKAGRPEDLLYRGQPLQEAKRQTQTGALVAAFIQASEKAEQARLEQARVNRWLRGLVFALGALLLLAIGAIFYAVQQQHEANQQATLANARLLLAQSKEVFDQKPLLGLQLALESATTAPPEMTREVSATLRQLLNAGHVTSLGQEVTQIYTTPLTNTILINYATRSSILQNLNTMQVITLSGKVKNDKGLYYSPENNGDFAIRYEDMPGEFRLRYNQQVVTLSDKIQEGYSDGVSYSPENNGDFVVRYKNMPSELRLQHGQQIIALSNKINHHRNVYYSSENNGDFVIGYEDAQGELRLKHGQQIIPLSGKVKDYKGVYYSPENNGDFVIVYEDAPNELRLKHGQQVITLSGNIIQYEKGVYYSPENNGDFVVGYSDMPGELRLKHGQHIITLSGKVNNYNGVYYSPENNGDFVVWYEDVLSELRLQYGQQIITLSGKVDGVYYSRENNGDFVVWYKGMPSELRLKHSQQVITLSGNINAYHYWALYYSHEDNGDFVVGYKDMPGELRLDHGQHVITLSGMVNGVSYNPENNGDFVIWYEDLPSEFRLKHGQQVITLSGKVNTYAGVYYSPKNNGDFVAAYSDVSAELRLQHGQQVTALSGMVSLSNMVNYSSAGTYFLVQYTNGTAEIWQLKPTRLLTQLGLGLSGHIFDEANDRLIVRYIDGRAYLVDLALLKAMRPESSLADLQQVGCEALQRNALWLNEAEVAPYLFGAAARACGGNEN